MKTYPTEHEEQVALCQWAALSVKKHPALELLYAIPNGGHRHITVAQRLKAEGVKPGIPDLCLPVARGPYYGLYVEMKRKKGGRTSPAQQEWINKLRAEGYCVEICKGFEEARDAIINYLNPS
jgi:hypothetical protein